MGLIRDGITALEDSPIIDIWRLGFDVPDVIGMWAGEPDVPTPPFICEAAGRALAEGHTFYSQNRGIPALREALAEYHRRLYGLDIPDSRITLTQSGMNAVMLVAQAMIEPGDNIVAVTPSWPNIMRAMQINRATVREAPLTRGPALPHMTAGASTSTGCSTSATAAPGSFTPPPPAIPPAG